MNLSRRPLVAGAAALFAAGLAGRIIGTLYRVLLVRTAGEEVVGLFQMTLPVYRVASTVASAGIPVAIARLAADAHGAGNLRLARRYGGVGLALTLVSATFASFVLFLTRSIWAHHFLTDPRTALTLAVLPLLIVPAAASASLRGVLQGEERLAPVALSSFAEVTSRVPAVLLFVWLSLPLGAAWASAGIAAGLAAGEMVSVAILLWCARGIWPPRGAVARRSARLHRPQPQRSSPRRGFSRFGRLSRRGEGVRLLVFDQLPVVRSLLAIALPLLCSGLVNSLLGVLNVALIPRQLMAAGYTSEEATILYGRLFGMALPALYMPMVAVHPLVHAAIPAVAKRLSAGRRAAVRRLLVQCFCVAGLVALAASGAFLGYGEEIGRFLYNVDGLGELIVPLAVAAPFAYSAHIASGILYGMGKTGVTMANAVAGNVVRLALIYLLAADPRWGITGALWAVVADYAVTAVLHLAAMGLLVRRALRAA